MVGTLGEQAFSTNAYRIFVTELGKHLCRAEEIFGAKELPSADLLRAASAAFHTIKGGAGFFGFEEITEIAGRLEKMLLDERFDIRTELETVKKLITQLKTVSASMPLPPTKSH